MAKSRTKKKPPAEDEFPGGPPPKPKPAPDPYGIAAKLAKSKRWEKASDVLDTITAVPTIFPDFNRKTTVGGLPVRRIHVVHGPSHGGKSIFVLGLIKSFIDRGFLGAYVDAEHATGLTFTEETMKGIKDRPNFWARRPENYEETIADLDDFLATCIEIRKEHPDFKAVAVIDSINKLVPKRELSKMIKGGKVDDKGAEEMAKGHHGRYRAALNQAWLDHLTPKLAAADCALIIIAQEREDHDADSWVRDAFKVKGGAALIFDSSLVMRVMKSSPVFDPPSEKKNENIVGFKHRVRIWKSKVGHMEGRYTDVVFHLSNGKLTPAGLDTARDAFMVAKDLGIIKVKGSWVSWGKFRTQGENKFVTKLSKNDAKLDELLAAIQSIVVPDEAA